MKDYFHEIGAWPHSHGIARSYALGFILSLALTFLAYALVVSHQLSQSSLIAAIVAAALVQFVVQLVCFLHLGRETGSREKLGIFFGAAFVVLILVSGSLWIMFSLSGRMMPDPTQMQNYMNEQVGF